MNQFILVSYANGNYSKDLYMKCLIYRLVYKISDAPIEWFSKRQSILVNNSILHSKIKHIEIQFYFIRKKSIIRDILINYVSTSKQQVDIITKPLETIIHYCLQEAIGILLKPNFE
uniref:Reverse transcriptase Ty1/copia-type domain-containing protein n=1 Tax=Physcomitrium patens TaxID=3218 RepID=A0A2K1KC03_PHYPA|nr:hypothetical protein PHYPA_010502 [Physcomitrium patens]